MKFIFSILLCLFIAVFAENGDRECPSNVKKALKIAFEACFTNGPRSAPEHDATVAPEVKATFINCMYGQVQNQTALAEIFNNCDPTATLEVRMDCVKDYLNATNCLPHHVHHHRD